MKAKDLIDIFRLPSATINLMWEKTEGNEPFYGRLVKDFYRAAVARHGKLLFARRYEYGFALCALPETFDMYFGRLEASGQRNYRKAVRLGYAMRRFDFNSRIEEVREIQRSAPVRQGKLPPEISEGRVQPISNPPSTSPFHDYPYFGAFKDGKLFAYASCFIAGELCNINDLFGHVRYHNDGVVPLLLIEIARELLKSYPAVKYYAYDTYFGAGENMRRFKRKFLFNPYHVDWRLSSETSPPAPEERMLVYRKDMAEPFLDESPPGTDFVMAAETRDVPRYFSTWVRSFGWWEAFMISFKIMSHKRIFFGLLKGNELAQSGWANLGFCRHYPVEADAAVLGTVWTGPKFRGQGLAPAAMRRVMSRLRERGCRRFYVDVGASNQASRRMIEKSGFLQRIA